MSSTLMYDSQYLYEVWYLRMQVFEAFLQLLNTCFFFIYFQGSLIANMIMGILILKKKYTLSKYLSVFMITLGISVCTIISGKDVVSILFKQLICCLYSTALSSKFVLMFWHPINIFLLESWSPPQNISFTAQVHLIWSEYVTTFSHSVRVHCK